jgi:1-acyl-sn-glycerol-3-phosphate acyltransferase
MAQNVSCSTPRPSALGTRPSVSTLVRFAQFTFLCGIRVPLRLMLRLACRVRVVGAERIPLRGGVLVAANHTSLADPPILQAFFPRHLTFLMAERFYFVPALTWLFRFWGCIPVQDQGVNRAALRAAADALAAGRALGVFPEGGLSRDGLVHDAQPGVALLALRTGVPILPVGIAGIERFLRPDTWTFHTTTATLVVGEPIHPEGQGREALAARVTEALRSCSRLARAANAAL